MKGTFKRLPRGLTTRFIIFSVFSRVAFGHFRARDLGSLTRVFPTEKLILFKGGKRKAKKNEHHSQCITFSLTKCRIICERLDFDLKKTGFRKQRTFFLQIEMHPFSFHTRLRFLFRSLSICNGVSVPFGFCFATLSRARVLRFKICETALSVNVIVRSDKKNKLTRNQKKERELSV